MPLALILSSYVAGSRVGGMAQALTLAAFKIDPIVAPTSLFGRHPGWGLPGGASVEAAVFQGVIDGLDANGLLGQADVALTGWFASAAQVEIAAETLDRARAAAREAGRREPIVIVDPIMGDQGAGLYVKDETAEAIAALLLIRADYVTPNIWELERLTGLRANDPASITQAARALDRPTLVTSAPAGEGEIGLAYIDRASAVLVAHQKLDKVPRGTGDVVCALFAAALIEGAGPAAATVRAARGLAEVVEAAQLWNAPELPLVALGERLVRPTRTSV
jgi:pyridoxine kinase